MNNSVNWPEMVSGEVVLTNEVAALYRQVHPSWRVNGLITSQAFKPTSKDNGKLSVVVSTAMTAKMAYIYHTQQELDSVGTYQVTVGEVRDCGLRSVDDSALPSSFLGHAYIDYRGASNKEIERSSKELRTRAMMHGIQFDPMA